MCAARTVHAKRPREMNYRDNRTPASVFNEGFVVASSSSKLSICLRGLTLLLCLLRTHRLLGRPSAPLLLGAQYSSALQTWWQRPALGQNPCALGRNLQRMKKNTDFPTTEVSI